MSNIDTKALRELEAKATKGEWTWEGDGRDTTLYAGRGQFHGYNLFGRLDPDMNGDANLNFICTARNAFPALLDEIERLRADLEEAEYCANLAGNLADQLQASRKEVEALKAEIERLEFDAMERDELDTMP